MQDPLLDRVDPVTGEAEGLRDVADLDRDRAPRDRRTSRATDRPTLGVRSPPYGVGFGALMGAKYCGRLHPPGRPAPGSISCREPRVLSAATAMGGHARAPAAIACRQAKPVASGAPRRASRCDPAVSGRSGTAAMPPPVASARLEEALEGAPIGSGVRRSSSEAAGPSPSAPADSTRGSRSRASRPSGAARCGACNQASRSLAGAFARHGPAPPPRAGRSRRAAGPRRRSRRWRARPGQPVVVVGKPGGGREGKRIVEQLAPDQRGRAGDGIGDQQRGEIGVVVASVRPVGLCDDLAVGGDQPLVAVDEQRLADRRRSTSASRETSGRPGRRARIRPALGAGASRTPARSCGRSRACAPTPRGRSGDRRRSRTSRSVARLCGSEQSSLTTQTQSASDCSRIEADLRGEQLRVRGCASPCRSRRSRTRPAGRRSRPGSACTVSSSASPHRPARGPRRRESRLDRDRGQLPARRGASNGTIAQKPLR